MDDTTVLARVSTIEHDGKWAEIYVEIGGPDEPAELYMTALTHHGSHTPKGFGVGMDLEMARSFAWELVLRLEALDG